ncbi:MAG: protein kinase, partial [Fuerstiella sp.]|nr:protein kinase [Fuerstiella sp.]
MCVRTPRRRRICRIIRDNFQCIHHRDIKPENILVTLTGEARLIDWGVAAQSETAGELTGGTLAYMSTEDLIQISGLKLTTERELQPGVQADIFAMGILLYEVTVGDLPSSSPIVDGAIVAAAREALPGRRRLLHTIMQNSDIPAGLRQIIAGCVRQPPDTEKQSAFRYRQMTQVADDLKAYLANQRVVHVPESMLATSQR